MILFCRYAKCFILTGLALPSGSQERDERQSELKAAVVAFLNKLDPALEQHPLNYIRFIKSQPPSILEIECASIAG